MRPDLRELSDPSNRDDSPADDELVRALRALPRAASGPAFRAAVLARAGEAERRRDLRRRGWSRVAAGAAVFALVLGLWGVEAARERAAAAGRRATLIDEHRRLQGELDELRELAQGRSRIPLGGDASTDLYLDLTNIPAGSADGRSIPPTRSSL